MVRGNKEWLEMMTNAQPEIILLTPTEKAQELRVSESTLARWRGQKSGPRFVKLGRGKCAHVRYLPLTVSDMAESEAV